MSSELTKGKVEMGTLPSSLNLWTTACPYCGKSEDQPVLCRTHSSESGYQKIHGAVNRLEDIQGDVSLCRGCGVAFVNPRYELKDFERIYVRPYQQDTLPKNNFEGVVKNVYASFKRFLIRNYYGKRRIKSRAARLCYSLFKGILLISIPSKAFQKGNILDIGCGDGSNLEMFNFNGNTLYGTEVLEVYRGLVQSKHPDVHFFVGDFVDWPLENIKFDFILLQSVFYRMANPKETLEKAYTALKPGGEITILEFFCPEPESVKRVVNINFPQGSAYIYDPDQYCKRLRELLPQASLHYELYYGYLVHQIRHEKMNLGNLLHTVLHKMYSQILKRNPYYIQLRIRKTE